MLSPTQSSPVLTTEQLYRHALALQPDHVHALCELSYLLSLREPGGRDVDEAERLRQRSLELRPDFANEFVAEAERHLGIAGGTHGYAEQELLRALHLQPDHARAQAALQRVGHAEAGEEEPVPGKHPHGES